eukprot:CAMPEP_0175139620 /NCGR_PEP_ID=MMETSP0087-20121206/11011_1 /TAXON_ID=136419 /ORGANISM="Unknown Unknown, Strain D1" /LENGTH=413 /DNA_ID=CAMNT_0016422665 /DNA_START=19 /DNA_END=1257 /DNA_ORIENTATION=-
MEENLLASLQEEAQQPSGKSSVNCSKKKLVGLAAVGFCLAAGATAAVYHLRKGSASSSSNLVAVRSSVGGCQGLCFAAVGDWGTTPGHDSSTKKDQPGSQAYWEDYNAQVNVGYLMGKWAAANPISFVLGHGDSFYWNGVNSPGDSRFQTTFESVYDNPSLMVPWLNVMGNHDYGGGSNIGGGANALERLFQAQKNYRSPNNDRWVMDDHSYSRVFTFKGAGGPFEVEVFNIDTNAAPVHGYNEICCQTYGYQGKGCGDDSCKAQFDYLGGCAPNDQVATCRTYLNDQFSKSMQWLQEALFKSTARWKIVNSHYHPRIHMSGSQQNSIYAIMSKGGVNAFFSGHTHGEGHDFREGIHYVLNGAGGGIKKAGDDGGPGTQLLFTECNYAFVGVDVTIDSLQIKFFGYGAGWNDW